LGLGEGERECEGGGGAAGQGWGLRLGLGESGGGWAGGAAGQGWRQMPVMGWGSDDLLKDGLVPVCVGFDMPDCWLPVADFSRKLSRVIVYIGYIYGMRGLLIQAKSRVPKWK